MQYGVKHKSLVSLIGAIIQLTIIIRLFYLHRIDLQLPVVFVWSGSMLYKTSNMIIEISKRKIIMPNSADTGHLVVRDDRL